MYICKYCLKEYENSHKYRGHLSVHTRNDSYKLLRETERSKKQKEVRILALDIGHKCKYCDKIFEKYQSLGRHTVMCKLNPKYAERKEIIKLKLIDYHKDHFFILKVSKSISDTINQKVKEGTWHYSFSKTRTYLYKGISLYGTWELQYAKFLDLHNIKWERVKESFPYEFNDKKSRYTPDFYLIDEDIYVEIKGYETNKDKAKWMYFPHKLLVLKGKELFDLGVLNKDQYDGKK